MKLNEMAITMALAAGGAWIGTIMAAFNINERSFTVTERV